MRDTDRPAGVRSLIVLAKAARPGLAKTRLARDGRLTLAEAARLARAFLDDTLAVCASAGVERVGIAYTPSDARGEFERFGPSIELSEQPEGDLGARLEAAFEGALRSGAERVVVIGADTPHLDSARIRAAFERLDDAQLVLGPSRDGGYYLIGTRGRPRGLFAGVEWSTPRVLSRTTANASALGLRVALLDEIDDIDGPAELDGLARRLEREPMLCPATAAALKALGRKR